MQLSSHLLPHCCGFEPTLERNLARASQRNRLTLILSQILLPQLSNHTNYLPDPPTALKHLANLMSLGPFPTSKGYQRSLLSNEFRSNRHRGWANLPVAVGIARGVEEMAGDLEDNARGSEVGVGGVERGGAVRADGRDDEDRRYGGRGRGAAE